MRLRDLPFKRTHNGSGHTCTQATGQEFYRRRSEFAHLMARLPRQYAPLVYGIIQAAITTAVATAIATHHLTDLSLRFLEEWSFAWSLAFLTMLPNWRARFKMLEGWRNRSALSAT